MGECVVEVNDPTGVAETTVNYQLSTVNSDAYYDLQGRRLNGKPTQPGLYIYKGKRITVKS